MLSRLKIIRKTGPIVCNIKHRFGPIFRGSFTRAYSLKTTSNNASLDDAFSQETVNEGNAGTYMERMYDEWVKDASSVDASWKSFFEEELQSVRRAGVLGHKGSVVKESSPGASMVDTINLALDQPIVRESILDHLKVQLLVSVTFDVKYILFLFLGACVSSERPSSG